MSAVQQFMKNFFSLFSIKEETQKINNILTKIDESIIIEKREIEKIKKLKDSSKSAKEIVNDLYKKLEGVG